MENIIENINDWIKACALKDIEDWELENGDLTPEDADDLADVVANNLRFAHIYNPDVHVNDANVEQYIEEVVNMNRDVLFRICLVALTDYLNGAANPVKPKYLVINAKRTDYSKESIYDTITVGELKRLLEDYEDNAKVVLSHDNGYTFGGITEDDLKEEEE